MPDGSITAWPDYMIDTFQRSVLFLDILRQRGNEAIDMQSRPTATVLRYGQEEIMSGRSLRRPMNYTLYRVIPPDDVAIDPVKRPVVVVDPRAGEGPGIGGFKAKSEIGDALDAGHPVYFIGFSANPEPGQQFLDVVEGQVTFFERVVALHPDAPRPFAIGNCQAGYQTLMVAMLRPDLFGPCLMAGSPMSFWQGVHGKNPMRYAGGLSGGSWLTALTSDLGNGCFDGTWLVLNFDGLGPANWLWGKQYGLYANVDTDGPRYIQFEKWWGDFIQLSGDELQFLVDNLFIGDKLTRNQLQAHDGTVFDVRNVTSPIIVFTSMGDNISPPQETLGWILDLYNDVEEIRAADRTIVYCMDQKIGHLAIFVSSKVGAQQDEEFVRLVDVIDCLPAGLFEIVISPRPANVAVGGLAGKDWISRFEARSLDDIRALGRNSPQDDRAFATVARVSALNLAAYRTFMQPAIRMMANQPMADMAMALNPLRLSYTMFADRNPWMTGLHALSETVMRSRKPVAGGSPLLALQTQLSDQITKGLDDYRKSRDDMQEKIFFTVFGSPFLQTMFGVNSHVNVRPSPTISPEKHAEQQVRTENYAARLRTGGADEALTRSVLYVAGNEQVLDQRCALVLAATHRLLGHLSRPAFMQLVRSQFRILQLWPRDAVTAIAGLITDPDVRAVLAKQVNVVVAAAGDLTAAENDRLSRLVAALSGQDRK